MNTISRRAGALALLVIALSALLPRASFAGFENLLVSSFSWSESQSGAFAFALGKDTAGRLVLQDQSPTGAVRLTRLGAGVALGLPRGAVLVGPDRVAWLTLSSRDAGVELYRLGDVSVPAPLQPVRVDSIAVGPSFDPASTELGIIAILIGLFRQPVPTISVQDGGVHRVFVWNGAHLLPFIEQDNLH